MSINRRIPVTLAALAVVGSSTLLPATAQAATLGPNPAATTAASSGSAAPSAAATLTSGTSYTAGPVTLTGTATPGHRLLLQYDTPAGAATTSATTDASGAWRADVFLAVPSTSSVNLSVLDTATSQFVLGAQLSVRAGDVDAAYVPGTLEWPISVWNSHGTRSGTGTPGAYLELRWGSSRAATVVRADGTWTVDVSRAPSRDNALSTASVVQYIGADDVRTETIRFGW